jgi:hypothetical protein
LFGRRWVVRGRSDLHAVTGQRAGDLPDEGFQNGVAFARAAGEAPRRCAQLTLAADEQRKPTSHVGWLLLSTVVVAQTPDGLTESALRAGPKNPKVVARPRCALLCLGAAGGALHSRHSDHRTCSPSWPCPAAAHINDGRPPAIGAVLAFKLSPIDRLVIWRQRTRGR